MSQLADDTTLVLLDILSVKCSSKCLNDFHIISGLQVNLDKALAKGIGTLINSIPDAKCCIKWTTVPLTNLGVTISNNPVSINKYNFDPRIQIMTDTLDIWLSRNLSLNGKVTILKSLALPKIQYPASCLSITTDTVEETNNIVSKIYGIIKGQR